MTRDQKRAGILAAVGGGGLFLLYRHQQAAAADAASGGATSNADPSLTNAGAFGSVTPYTPQDPVLATTSAGGEAVYDPNSGVLFGAQDVAGPQTTAPGAPSYVVKVNYAKPRVKAKRPNRHPHRKHPSHRKKKKVNS